MLRRCRRVYGSASQSEWVCIGSMCSLARVPRIIVPADPHSLIQRGHTRQAIFCTDADSGFSLACLWQARQPYQCRLSAYILMPHSYEVLDMRPLDGERLLATAVLEENVLALLGRSDHPQSVGTATARRGRDSA